MVAVVVITLAVVAQAGVLLAMYLLSRRIASKLELLMDESRKLIAPLESITNNLKAVADYETGPWSEVVGPVVPRGGPAGMILRGGRIVAEWGDTARPDMTFSVAKSYLSLLAGIAVGDGLIRELDEPVALTVTDGGFEGPHNGAITWRHLLPW